MSIGEMYENVMKKNRSSFLLHSVVPRFRISYIAVRRREGNLPDGGFTGNNGDWTLTFRVSISQVREDGRQFTQDLSRGEGLAFPPPHF